MTAQDVEAPQCASVSATSLSWRYTNQASAVHRDSLQDITFNLPAGSRCLLVGENGAGKSTLLRLLAGKNMTPRSSIDVAGGHPFFEISRQNEIAYLGGSWVRDLAFAGYGVAYQADIPASQMLEGLPLCLADPKRIERLKDVLEIDLTWRMHLVSDGQRRRMQILLGLMASSKVLLLDEITTDLDVVARQRLIEYLYQETLTEQPATVIYATHIFDGLSGWATHVLHLEHGKVRHFGPLADFLKIPRNVGESATEAAVAAAIAADAEHGTAEGLSIDASSLALFSWTPLALLVFKWVDAARHYLPGRPAISQQSGPSKAATAAASRHLR